MKITPFIEEFLKTSYEDDEIKVQHNYSGKFMYGELTSAIICDPSEKQNLVRELIEYMDALDGKPRRDELEYARELIYDINELSPSEKQELKDFYHELTLCREDDMGLQKVYY